MLIAIYWNFDIFIIQQQVPIVNEGYAFVRSPIVKVPIHKKLLRSTLLTYNYTRKIKIKRHIIYMYNDDILFGEVQSQYTRIKYLPYHV